MHIRKWIVALSALACCAVQAQPQAPLPDLASFKQRTDISPDIWKLPAGQPIGALVEKQKAMPRRYAVSGRLVQGFKGNPTPRITVTTGTFEMIPLGEGFILRRGVARSDESTTQAEELRWFGLVDVAGASSTRISRGGGSGDGESKHITTRITGTAPDFSKMAPGYAFSYQTEAAFDYKGIYRIKPEDEPREIKRATTPAVQHECVVQAPVPAKTLEATLPGNALPIACKITEAGKSRNAPYYYLEAYATVIDGDFFGGATEVQRARFSSERKVEIIKE
jgi:hypothetical protein